MFTRDVENTITEITRRAVIDYLMAGKIRWAGSMDEHAFLGRLYDLTNIESTDHRFNDAARDIQQHRVINPNDWPDDWVFYDSRFNLLWASDEEFLRFLCETVHPAARRPDETRALVAAYNAELTVDGWQLVKVKEISGRAVYGYQKVGHRTAIFEEPTGWQKVDRQMQEVKARLETAKTEEQFQAVGLLCREVLISVAQAVFDRARHISADPVPISETDSRRMLESVFERELSGNVNEEARAHAKAALKLALALQHKRTADFRMAALCAEGTSSVVNMLAVLSERRRRLV